MKKVEFTLPRIALIIGSHAMGTDDVALLLADKLTKDSRKAIV